MKRLICAVAIATVWLTTPSLPVRAEVTLHIDSATVHKTGSGARAVILIPGLGCGAYVYDTIVTELAERMTVYTVAFDGFDGASAGKAPYLPSFTQSVAHLVEREHLVRPLVIGHSLGGHIALRLAEVQPTLFSAVMAIDALPVFPLVQPGETAQSRMTAALAMQAALLAATNETFASRTRASVAELVTDPSNVDLVAAHTLLSDRATFAGAATEMMLEDLTPNLSKIRVPITVLAPASRYTPDQTAAFYAMPYAGVSDLTIVPIANSRHFIMLDQPAAFRNAVDAFVSANAAKT